MSDIADNEVQVRPDIAKETAVPDDLEALKDMDSPSSAKLSIDSLSSFAMREISIPIPRGEDLRVNWFTSFFGFGILWGLSAWCIIDPENALGSMVGWKTDITRLFTWFIIGTKPIFVVFVIFIAIRFRNIRLGPQDGKPEFSNVTYFCMMFSSGVENALFFYGVAEPLWHQSTNWYTNTGYKTQDEIDQFAMNQTLFHWGITPWSQYILVAICMGLACYKFHLPLTFRSCFYPLLGKYTWGWIGDVIDGFTIVTTIAGVCTSLGLGILQIVDGLKRLGWVEDATTTEEEVRTAVVTIWVITVISTISLTSGLNVGIKYLSQLGFCLGMLLLFLVLAMDKTYYVLNLLVQSTGYYIQNSLVLINFWTDAFGQLTEGEGRAIDNHAAESWWYDAWTVFYWAWWTAWSGFVGMFLARISKGRTIAEVVLYGLGAAILYTILWFCTYGGVGLRQARQALELQKLGTTTFNNAGEFLAENSTYCYDVPQEDLVVNGTTVFTNTLLGVTPVCLFNEEQSGDAWYNVMYSFSFPTETFTTGFGPFLSGVTILALLIYFVTSSDSASLMVSHMSSNGKDHHWLQRIFWSLTEGAVCTALMVAGQSNALQALQSAAIIAGLPFTLFLVFQAQSTWVMCNCAEQAETLSEYESPIAAVEDRLSHQFEMPIYGGILNIFEWIISFGRVREEQVAEGTHLPSKFHVVEFFKALLLPFLSIYQIRSQLHPKSTKSNAAFAIAYGIFFIGWVAMFISVTANRGFVAFGFALFFLDAVLLTNIRIEVRNLFQLKGNLFEDFTSSSFFYPQGIVQILYQLDYCPQKSEEKIIE